MRQVCLRHPAALAASQGWGSALLTLHCLQGKAWDGLAWLAGSWTPCQGWLLYPLCCSRVPKVPRVLAALQPALPPPSHSPGTGTVLRGCPQGLPLRHIVKKNKFSTTMAVQFPGESGNSLCPAPNPSLVLTHPSGAHFCSHRSSTCHLQAESLQMSSALSPH